MESLGTGGAKRLFSFLSPFPAIPSLVPPEPFLKVKNNIDNKKTGKMILPVFLLSIS